MARLVLEMELQARIGVGARERRRAQPLQLRMELEVDSRRAAASDSLADALDYQALERRIRELVAASSCKLIESLGEAICAVATGEFGAPRVRLQLAKPQALERARATLVIDARAAACHNDAPPAAGAARKDDGGESR